MRLIFRLLAVLLAGLVLVLLVNTLRLPNHQLGALPAVPTPALVLDSTTARLAGA